MGTQHHKKAHTQCRFAENAVSQGQRRQSPSPLVGSAPLQTEDKERVLGVLGWSPFLEKVIQAHGLWGGEDASPGEQ